MSRRRAVAIISLVLVGALLLVVAATLFISAQNHQGTPSGTATASVTPSGGWIARQGGSLYLNGQVFRFSGANVYWLGNDENYGHAYPTHFRVDDVLATAQIMGATVIRTFAVQSVGAPYTIEPSLGVFNDSGFQSIDYALLSARQHNLHVIMTLVDNHNGKQVYLNWRGLQKLDDFYTNKSVLKDFEQHINHVLNHVDPFTGLAYKDDPTIMAWETGNEMRSPTNVWKFDSWTETIAQYIKSIDPRHLVIDGHSAGNRGKQHTLASSVALPDVDIYAGHYYPMDVNYMQTDANTVHAGNKVFFIGEYDWIGKFGPDPGQATLTAFLGTILNTSYIAGDLFWSLFGHSDGHGFEQHGDHLTLHYPGDSPDMKARVQIIRRHAYAMRGQSLPAGIVLAAPLLYTPVKTAGGISVSWRGVAGADTYSVQRSSDGKSWQTGAAGLTDDDTPWLDTSVQPGVNYQYRVQPVDIANVPGRFSAAAVVSS